MPRRFRVLLVDDDPILLRSVARLLSDHFDVDTVTDPLDAVEACRQTGVDILLTDLEMPQMGGEELVARIREVHPSDALAVVVLTGTMVSAVAGADIVIHKPIDGVVLKEALERAVVVAQARGAAGVVA